jgi:hypothetical protein
MAFACYTSGGAHRTAVSAERNLSVMLCAVAALRFERLLVAAALCQFSMQLPCQQQQQQQRVCGTPGGAAQAAAE